ncbi:MAG: oligosaccharide flippase family protein, partial [Pirellulales bacterium]
VAIKLIGAGLALALQIVLARTLEQAGYGTYAYVLAWVQVALILSQAGFATAALKYIAEYRARGEESLVAGFRRRSVQLTLLQSCALALLLAGGAAVWHRSDSVAATQNFLIAALAVPVLSLFFLGGAIVRGSGHAISSMLGSLAQPLLLLIALLPIFALHRGPISVNAALLMYLIASAGGLLVVYSQWRCFAGVQNPTIRCDYRTREWFGTASMLTSGALLMYLQGRTGVLMSGLFLDARSAGTYAAMERLADVALLGVIAVNMLVAPQFSSLHAKGRRSELRRHARFAAWVSTGFMLCVVLPLVVFGKQILRLFGDEFVAGYPVLVVLLVGLAANAISGSADHLLNMTGHQRTSLKVLAAGLSVNLMLSVWLIPRYGIFGTALANAGAITFWSVGMVWAVRARLGIWSNVGRVDSTAFV